ncbi:MAG: hypothetical protein AAF542_21475 [Pseudomonadota bacterium]
MKKYLYLPLLSALLAAAPISAQETKPAHSDWPTAAIYAINLQERKLVLDQKVFRVALKATVLDTDNSKMAFSELEPQYYVAYRLEAATGDIVDIVAVAKP